MRKHRTATATRSAGTQRQAARVQRIREEIVELTPGALFIDGFDDALVGWVASGSERLAVYDLAKMVKVMQRDDGSSWEDAMEYIEYNILTAYVGGMGPVIVKYCR